MSAAVAIKVDVALDPFEGSRKVMNLFAATKFKEGFKLLFQYIHNFCKELQNEVIKHKIRLELILDSHQNGTISFDQYLDQIDVVVGRVMETLATAEQRFNERL